MKRILFIFLILFPALTHAQDTTYVYYNNMKLEVSSNSSIVISTEKRAKLDYEVVDNVRKSTCEVVLLAPNGSIVKTLNVPTVVNRKGVIATLVASDPDYLTIHNWILNSSGFVRFNLPGIPNISFVVPCRLN